MRFKKVLGEKLDGVEGFGKRVREKGLGMGDGVEGKPKVWIGSHLLAQALFNVAIDPAISVASR